MLTSRVRVLSRDIMSDPKHVNINFDKLYEVQIEKPETKQQNEYSKEILDCELTASAINYCYWYGKSNIRPSGSGAVRMYELLHEAYKNSYGQELQFAGLLVQSLAMNGFPLHEQRRRHIFEVLIEEVPECFWIRATKGSVNVEDILKELVVTFPGYASDLFLKRAQLFVLQMHRIVGGIKDIDLLTVPADYVVPRILREMGVINYSDELAGAVDNHELIIAGSLQEVEIRAATIVACDEIACNNNVTAGDVDTYFWFSRKKYNKMPHHLTVTTDY